MKEKKQPDNTESTVQRQQRLQVRMGIRVLVLLYLCYLIYALIQGWRRGEAGMSGGTVALFCGLFAAAIVAIAILSLRQWKRAQEEMDRIEAEERARRQRQIQLGILEEDEEDEHDE